MLKKPITYHDINDVERTENFYFNFTEAEIAEMELASEGTLREQLQEIMDAKNGRQIMDAFKRIIGDSYGVRTEDGRGIRKSTRLTEEFMSSNAYSALFMELIGDPDAALKFVEQILPASRRDQPGTPTAPQDYKPSARDIANQKKEEVIETNDPWAGVPRVNEPQPTPAMSPSDIEAFRAWQDSQRETQSFRAPVAKTAPPHLRDAINAGNYGDPAEAWARFNETGDPSARIVNRPPHEG